MQYPDKFVDLNDPSVEGRWLDWKAAQATTIDGQLIGYGTDIGPTGICYRADLFEKAGLRIVAQKRVRLTRAQAEGFYGEHKARGFWDGHEKPRDLFVGDGQGAACGDLGLE